MRIQYKGLPLRIFILSMKIENIMVFIIQNVFTRFAIQLRRVSCNFVIPAYFHSVYVKMF
jgi:TctA family transporter